MKFLSRVVLIAMAGIVFGFFFTAEARADTDNYFYEITFDANGGHFTGQHSGDTTYIAHVSSDFPTLLSNWPPNPVFPNDQYKFDDWYTEREGGTKVSRPQHLREILRYMHIGDI